jgi:ribosomal protein S13
MQNVKTVNMPEGAVSGDETSPVLGLNRLVEAVKLREEKFGYVLEEQLLAVAQHLTQHYHWLSRLDREEAVKVLAKYHMATLIGNRHKIEKALRTQNRARCARCGLVITSKKSLETGLGIICRKKVGLEPEKPTPPRRDLPAEPYIEEDVTEMQLCGKCNEVTTHAYRSHLQQGCGHDWLVENWRCLACGHKTTRSTRTDRLRDRTA